MSGGRVNLWLLPNLDDDKLGVLESFLPLYSLKYKKKKKKSPVKQNETDSTETEMKEKENNKTDD